ncbi:hypothetical protein SPFM9_00197 [Salmonella phage SPFM9]|nr:hypothetical protein SPFM9_00197 [Salmonella phage SPFM9]
MQTTTKQCGIPCYHHALEGHLWLETAPLDKQGNPTGGTAMGVKYGNLNIIMGDDLATPVDAVYYLGKLHPAPEKLQEFAWALHGQQNPNVEFRVIPQDDRYREIVVWDDEFICYLPDEKKLWLKMQFRFARQWANTIDQNTGKKDAKDYTIHFSSGGCWCGPDQSDEDTMSEMYMRLLRGFNALRIGGKSMKKIYKIAVIGSRKTTLARLARVGIYFFLTNRPLLEEVTITKLNGFRYRVFV